ncbi:MAG TPA: beta-ketoacyl-ACP synthase II [Verrucomicrobiae bacterium]|jgi:3-oxoacyl-[acyl-carrier-protein] synthase II|nr:beta-ketoacyl-ACP synthase II [Verrucomicrobiae bacterium]
MAATDCKNRRIVVTGIGAVTPLGNSAAENWENMKAAKSGIAAISLFDASDFPTRIAGEVKNFDFGAAVRDNPRLSEAGRGTFFAFRAAQEAVRDSGLKEGAYDSRRFGLYFGAADSGFDFNAFAQTMTDSFVPGTPEIHPGEYITAAVRNMSAVAELEAQPFMTLSHLASWFRLRGPVCNSLTACAASSQAIGEAFEWIRRGDADIMMTGGSHSMVYPLGIAGFSLLTALSTRNDDPARASRPFDKNRDGFVLAEGACVLIVEELSHAVKRGARIYGEIVGYGATSDAYRMTDMDPEGAGACRAVEIAMKKAGLTPEGVDYVNAHGTATQINDAIETLVIKKALGERAYKIPVSSIKSMVGHMIAGAGALELAACLFSIRDSVVPPTINYETPDPKCDLDYVPNEARAHRVRAALSNSFGFGGQNICLAVKHYEI